MLFGSHEPIVDLLGDGMLSVVRHPEILARLRSVPDLIPATVEELLRYEPPIQFFASRTTLGEITLAGTTIPKGVVVTWPLAAGNRDPARFPHPDPFTPDRLATQHLGICITLHISFV